MVAIFFEFLHFLRTTGKVFVKQFLVPAGFDLGTCKMEVGEMNNLVVFSILGVVSLCIPYLLYSSFHFLLHYPYTIPIIP